MAGRKTSFFLRQALWEAHGHRCGYCLNPLKFAEMEVEHIVPLAFQDLPGEEWQITAKKNGLPPSFEFEAPTNFLPSCRTCNRRKGSEFLIRDGTILLLSIAERMAPRVVELSEWFRQEDDKDRQRFALAGALDAGTLTKEDVQNVVSSVRATKGIFSLSAPFSVFGDASLKELSQQQYDYYLDHGLALPDWLKDGLKLDSDSSDVTHVKTLREYVDARSRGFYPLSNACMKTAAAWFERPLDVLKALKKARVAERSFIDDPKKGIADIALLPASLLFNLEEKISPDTTIQALVTAGKANITRVASDLIEIDYDEHWTVLLELMRADLDGDGIQDMLVHVGGGPLGGTMYMSYTTALARRSTTEPFSIVPNSTPSPEAQS